MPPVPLIRRNYVIRKLRACGALSPQTAVTFREAGVFNPDGFRRVTQMMLRRGWIAQVGERFYLTR